MELESLKSIGWLLLWGTAFFVMMRYGCGVHMRGGHGHSGHGRDEAATKPSMACGPRTRVPGVPPTTPPIGETQAGGQTRDPVCGMEVDPRSAAAAYVRGGRTYYFCSASCRDRFERTPEKFTGAPGQEGHHG